MHSERNTLLTWGWNEHGMCGTGDEQNVVLPRVLQAFDNGQTVGVGCGSGHSMAVIGGVPRGENT